MSLGADGGSDDRLLQLCFLEADPADCWAAIPPVRQGGGRRRRGPGHLRRAIAAHGRRHRPLHRRAVVTGIVHQLSQLLDSFDLGSVDNGRYRARNAGEGRDVIFGGQLLAQSIVAAVRDQPDKEVKTIHTIFARGGKASEPVELEIGAMHSGRTFGSVTVTVWQGERLCARSLVLLHLPEPDLIRHAAGMPPVDRPDATPASDYGFDGWQIGVVGGVDLSDPDAVGPAELFVWTRFKGAPDDLTTSQALLAYATDGFLIGTAMRPHAGVGQAQAHRRSLPAWSATR